MIDTRFFDTLISALQTIHDFQYNDSSNININVDSLSLSNLENSIVSLTELKKEYLLNYYSTTEALPSVIKKLYDNNALE